MATFIPDLNTNSQQQQNSSLQNQSNQPSIFTPNLSTQPNQPSFSEPNSSLTQQRSNPIDLCESSDNYVNSEDKNANETDNDNNIISMATKNELESKPQSNDSQEKQQEPQQENQQKRGWFSSIFSKFNPFSSSKVVDLNQHDNGEMVWNGHRYVMKGHENDDDSQNLLPPPPKGLAPIAKSKSSPFPVIEPQKAPPPPGGAAVFPDSQPPPPPPAGPPPPASGSITSPPIGAVAPVGRTRVSKRYVAYI